MKNNNQVRRDKLAVEFSRLRNFGFKVFNFGFEKTLPGDLKYFVSHIIISKKYLVFVEIRTRSRDLPEQKKDLAEFLSHLTVLNRSVHYRIVSSLKDCRILSDLLLTNKL